MPPTRNKREARYRHDKPRTEVNDLVVHMVRQIYLTGQFPPRVIARTCNLDPALVREILKPPKRKAKRKTSKKKTKRKRRRSAK